MSRWGQRDLAVGSFACKHCHQAKREHPKGKCLYLPTDFEKHCCRKCGGGFDAEDRVYRDGPETNYHPLCYFDTIDWSRGSNL